MEASADTRGDAQQEQTCGTLFLRDGDFETECVDFQRRSASRAESRMADPVYAEFSRRALVSQQFDGYCICIRDSRDFDAPALLSRELTVP